MSADYWFWNLSQELGDDLANGTVTWDGDNTSWSSVYQVPLEGVIVLSLCYGSISLLALIGNACVIGLIATSRRMRSLTNCYIANLACADFIISLFAIPFHFQAAMLQRWNLPDVMCAICPFVEDLSVNVSIFTLTTIAVDRYCAILYPLQHRPTRSRVKAILGGIWVLSGTASVPNVVALRVVRKPGDATGTVKPFCENVGMDPGHWDAYHHFLFALQYLIPLVVISYAYLRMSWVLWGTKVPGNAQIARDASLVKNKKKVIKMLLIVVIMFAICWLPLQTYRVLQAIFPAVNKYTYINIIWFCCHWLAMSNSCCNPFIYGIYNERFKREFKARLRTCCKCQETLLSTNSKMSRTNTLQLSLRGTQRQRSWHQNSNTGSQMSSL